MNEQKLHEVIAGNGKDFSKFIEKFSTKDQTILKMYWKKSQYRKGILAIRKINYSQAQIYVLPFHMLPKIHSYLKLNPGEGFAGIRIESGKILIFSDRFTDEPKTDETKVEVKKRGPRRSKKKIRENGEQD